MRSELEEDVNSLLQNDAAFVVIHVITEESCTHSTLDMRILRRMHASFNMRAVVIDMRYWNVGVTLDISHGQYFAFYLVRKSKVIFGT